MIVRIVLGAVALALAALALYHPAAKPAAAAFSGSEPPPRAPAAPRRSPGRRGAGAAATGMLVYVAGAVERPGLYHLPEGARAADAVAMAGGLTARGGDGALNLAERLADGDEVYAPAAGEPAPGQRRTRRRGTPTAPAAPVDVNVAASAELARVPGIGRALAARIVEMRERAGPFASLDELLDVAGMTQAHLDRARTYLRPP